MDALTKKYEIFAKALSTLHEAIIKIQHTANDDSEYDTRRDSLIKRFEYCTDLLWKYLKLYLEERYGFLEASPKKVYRACVVAQIVTEPEGEQLLEMVDVRNQTSHTYNEGFAETLSLKIPVFYADMHMLAQKIKP